MEKDNIIYSFDGKNEQKLNEHLISQNGEWFKCGRCGFKNNIDEWMYDDEKDELVCPNCKYPLKL